MYIQDKSTLCLPLISRSAITTVLYRFRCIITRRLSQFYIPRLDLIRGNHGCHWEGLLTLFIQMLSIHFHYMCYCFIIHSCYCNEPIVYNLPAHWILFLAKIKLMIANNFDVYGRKDGRSECFEQKQFSCLKVNTKYMIS